MKDYKNDTIVDVNKGIALVTGELADLDTVGASWYYTWSHFPIPTADSRYIPMSYYGLFDDNLPADYDGFVLFLNEPNNDAPFGADIDPYLAALRYREFVKARPHAKLVVGNTSAWASMWHDQFIKEVILYGDVPLPQYIGLHGYIESYIKVENIDFFWNQIRCVYGHYDLQPEVWITEFADTTGDVASLQAFLDLIYSNPKITRYAYFTNRYDPEAAYIPQGWHDFGLFENGVLSSMGEVYRTRGK